MPERLQLLHYDYVPEGADAEAFAGEDPYVAAELVTAWRVEPCNVVV